MEVANSNDKWSLSEKLTLAILTTIISPVAFADLQGGIKKAEDWAGRIRDGLLTIGGIIAVIYLLWKALECWRGRADWGEFAMSVLYVAIAGSSAALAGWAWTVFTT
ncbi:TrbC/VirB2 family protein (plasmid) [Moraxella lincolnii]|uniref:TrbC/VirB2 family protein n=1 Tax=Lwoffella lincolnii TaxID=90241 RepID=UPI0030CEBB73